MSKKKLGIFTRSFSKISKRKRFIIATAILTLGLMFYTFSPFSQVVYSLIFILILVYVCNYFAILEGITRYEWLFLFIMPLYFTLVFCLGYTFFPQRWLTRLPFIIIYTISIYAIMLSQNIFNVGIHKSIQLYRAAFSVNYLYITISSFIAYSLILSFHFNFILNGLFVGIATFPLVLHYIWSVNPKDIAEKQYILLSLLISMVTLEIALVLSFAPIISAIFALCLTSIVYSLLGLFHAHMQEMLFKERVREYIVVLIIIGIIAFLSLAW